MPSTAARVQANIGATRAFAFDLTAACSGVVFALATAEKYISSGMYRRGIVIGSETLSKVLDWSDRSTSVLLEMELVVSCLKRAIKNRFG